MQHLIIPSAFFLLAWTISLGEKAILQVPEEVGWFIYWRASESKRSDLVCSFHNCLATSTPDKAP